MPLPPAHFLFGAGAAEAVRPGNARRPWLVWLLGGCVAVLPDLDLFVGFLFGRGREFHGFFSHTPLAVLLLGLAVGRLAGPRWGGVVGAAYGSHLVADLLQERRVSSVQLWWPFSERASGPLYPLFPTASLDIDLEPVALILSVFEPGIRSAFLEQTAMAALFFLVVVGIRRLL